jgi:hypothetical protein
VRLGESESSSKVTAAKIALAYHALGVMRLPAAIESALARNALADAGGSGGLKLTETACRDVLNELQSIKSTSSSLAIQQIRVFHTAFRRKVHDL